MLIRMATCLIALGSNQGESVELLSGAVNELQAHQEIDVVHCSRWYRTRPAGGPKGQAGFVNGAALLATTLAPEDLLRALHAIEQQFGRRRDERWGPRTIDLDLLLYEDRVLRTESLTLPHPRMAYRRFVLEPAVEIAPGIVHPSTGWTLRQLLDHLNAAADYVAVTGPPGTPTDEVVALVAQRCLVRVLPAGPLSDDLWMPAHADSAGLLERQLLESLQSRVRLLEQLPLFEAWQGASVVTLSNFWIEEWPVLAHAAMQQFDESTRDRLCRRWQSQRERVTNPKLLVILDGGADACIGRTVARGASSTENLRSDWEEVRQQLLDRAKRHHAGPLLHLPAWPVAEAVTEVAGALESMHTQA